MKTLIFILAMISSAHFMLLEGQNSFIAEPLPEITCPGTVVTSTDQGECYASGIQLGNATIDPPDGSCIVSNDAPVFFFSGATQVVWTVSDSSGNSASCVQMVFVKDEEPPAIVCPPTMYKNNDMGLCSYTVQGAEFDPLSAADNCAGFSIINDRNNSGTLDDVILPKGLHTITWVATDAGFNATACSFQVVINDTEAPEVLCPSDFSLSAEAGECHYMVSGGIMQPVAVYENCGSVTMYNNVNHDVSLDGYSFMVGVTVVTWTITDESGNFSQCAFEVSVTDDELPWLECPADQLKNTDPNLGFYTVSATEFDLVTYGDNCQVIGIQNNYDGFSTLSGAVFYPGTTHVNWVVIDAGFNMMTCSFSVTVKDNEDPYIYCVDDQFRGVVKVVDLYVVDGGEFDPAGYFDNCPGTAIVNDYNGMGSLSGAAFPEGVTTVTWIVTDASFNIASCSFDISVSVAGKSTASGNSGSFAKPAAEAGLGFSEILPDPVKASVSNFPNPFSGSTEFVFTMPEDDRIVISLFDLSGNFIKTIFEGEVEKGARNSAIFCADVLASGIYVYTLKSSSDFVAGRISLIN